MRAYSLLLLTAVLLLAACDSGDGDEPIPVFGELSATVTSSAGDSTTFTGNAFAQFDGDVLRQIMLSEADAEGRLGSRAVVFSPLEPGPLQPGTYAVSGLAESDAPFVGLYSDFSSGLGAISTDSGELTVEAVTGSEVRGQFRIEGSGRPIEAGGPRRYTIRGSFEALITRVPDEGRGD
jgi:hypothetical protein